MLYDPVENTAARSCDACRYWWQEKVRRTAAGWGQCRRMPPSLPSDREDKLKLVGIWPETEANDWCGEWRARDGIGSDPS